MFLFKELLGIEILDASKRFDIADEFSRIAVRARAPLAKAGCGFGLIFPITFGILYPWHQK